MSVESMLDKIVDKLISMENNFTERFEKIDQRFDEMDKRFEMLEAKVRKNSLMLENLENKVDDLAEVVQSNRQQNEGQHAEILSALGERIEVIETVIKRVK